MDVTLKLSGTLEDVNLLLRMIDNHLKTPGANGRDVEVTAEIPAQVVEFKGDTFSINLQATPQRFSLGRAKEEPEPKIFPDDLSLVEIEELELGVRTYNYLKRIDVQTVADLVDKTEAELREIPNVLDRSIKEIEDTLALQGLKLREEDDGLDVMLIEELELGVRPYSHLKRSGIQTVGQLVRTTREAIQAIPNIGPGSEEEIREVLRSRGLYLKFDGPTGKEELSIGQLDLSRGTRHFLHENAFGFVGDLLKVSWQELRDLQVIPRFSYEMELDLKRALIKQGVGLKWDSKSGSSALAEIKIEDLELGSRALGVLRRGGVITVDDLVNQDEYWLKALPNCGSKTQQEIVEALHARGLDFKQDD